MTQNEALALFEYQNGKLYFEINQKYGAEIKTLLQKNNFIDVRILKDINQNDRMVSGMLI
jgi:release factor glutamine methyltransferase